MFDLVADVERYPDFLGWIEAAEVHENDATRQRASLLLKLGGMRWRITTLNRLQRASRLDLALESGPFRRFSGHWSFEQRDGGCKVELALEFQFDNPLMIATFSRSFKRVADRMVDDFCQRAGDLHD